MDETTSYWKHNVSGHSRRWHVGIKMQYSPAFADPSLILKVVVRDGTLTANHRQPLFNAMSQERTASDGGTQGGPLCTVQRPITADGTLPTEQLVWQLASCKCNDCQMWAAPVRTAINTNTSKEKKLLCKFTQPAVSTFGNFMSTSLREWLWYLLFSLLMTHIFA